MQIASLWGQSGFKRPLHHRREECGAMYPEETRDAAVSLGGNRPEGRRIDEANGEPYSSLAGGGQAA
jgi:hypothetical protein